MSTPTKTLTEFLESYPTLEDLMRDKSAIFPELIYYGVWVKNLEQFRLELIQMNPKCWESGPVLNDGTKVSTIKEKGVACWITFEALSLDPEKTFRFFVETFRERRLRFEEEMK
jgi:hypothetical protein